MRARQLVAVAAALAALAGCGSKPAAERQAPAAPSPAPSAALDAETLDATAEYLSALGRLDGALVADRRAALDRGAATCLDIADKKPEKEQERNVATRFAVDPARARKILAVAKSDLCLD